jgi:hypothetical protein
VEIPFKWNFHNEKKYNNITILVYELVGKTWVTSSTPHFGKMYHIYIFVVVEISLNLNDMMLNIYIYIYSWKDLSHHFGNIKEPIVVALEYWLLGA